MIIYSKHSYRHQLDLGGLRCVQQAWVQDLGATGAFTRDVVGEMCAS